MDPIEEFKKSRTERIKSYSQNQELQRSADHFNISSNKERYSYNFSWMGMPIIQYPQDMVAMQEIIWEVKPDLIIETGIAHGGSLVFYSSLLELIGNGQVLGVDIEIRPHNKKRIEDHPMYKRISMIEGSSIESSTFNQICNFAKDKEKVLVCLDSNHTHDHVLKELELYAPLVSVGSYCVVFDTIIEKLPKGSYPDRPWDVGNNPMTATKEYLKKDTRFLVDEEINRKLLISVSPDGYLKRIK